MSHRSNREDSIEALLRAESSREWPPTQVEARVLDRVERSIALGLGASSGADASARAAAESGAETAHGAGASTGGAEAVATSASPFAIGNVVVASLVLAVVAVGVVAWKWGPERARPEQGARMPSGAASDSFPRAPEQPIPPFVASKRQGPATQASAATPTIAADSLPSPVASDAALAEAERMPPASEPKERTEGAHETTASHVATRHARVVSRAARAIAAAPVPASTESPLALVTEAQRLLSRHDAATALERLARDEALRPRSPYAEEREQLRILCLIALERHGEARSLADAFHARHPGSAYWPAISHALGHAQN